MSTDQILDAKAEFEKSRTASARLLESLAQKIGGRRSARSAASRLGQTQDYPRASFTNRAGSSLRDLFREPLAAALAAMAGGYLLGILLRQTRR